MADPGAKARIEDLKRRLEIDPGSRLFVALAEEYRKNGLLPEALSTLQKGLLAHPHYISAQVALGRAYLESGLITEAIATFSKVLVADPGNLVSAKSLADIYLSRGEAVEAVKKYKLYRALSGDKGVEEIIARLERETAPPPPPAATPRALAAPPPPPTFVETPTGPIRMSRAAAPAAAPEPLELTHVRFEPGEESHPSRAASEPFGVVSRDLPLPEAPIAPPRSEASDGAGSDAATRAVRISEILPRPDAGAPRPPAPAEPVEAAPGRGRTLADLYFAQGHYAEALRIYDDLVAANPLDEELRRLRRDAEARLLPAGTTPGGAAPDPALERRLARIRVLKRWLSVLQAG
jgi:tetratricopeptide (TPR) repeat protein